MAQQGVVHSNLRTKTPLSLWCHARGIRPCPTATGRPVRILLGSGSFFGTHIIVFIYYIHRHRYIYSIFIHTCVERYTDLTIEHTMQSYLNPLASFSYSPAVSMYPHLRQPFSIQLLPREAALGWRLWRQLMQRQACVHHGWRKALGVWLRVGWCLQVLGEGAPGPPVSPWLPDTTATPGPEWRSGAPPGGTAGVCQGPPWPHGKGSEISTSR